jgi:hypothetical protein
MGDQDGPDLGNVVIELDRAVAGRKLWTVPSASVTIASEAGSVAGIEVTLPGGRRMFLLAANVLAIIDATTEGAE